MLNSSATVANDEGLSPVIDTNPEIPHIDFSNGVPVVDSSDQSTVVPCETNDVEPVVPQETNDADPVADAVATAVEQWIGFDPAIHAVNEDGTPRLKVDGTYARKRGKGGRKSADGAGETDLFTNAPGETVSEVPRETVQGVAPASPTQTAPNLSSQQAAAMVVMACTTVMSKLVGPEWAAEKPEQKALTDATKIYLDSKGGLNVTPEMGLFIAVSMYAVPRLAHENTRSKFGLAVDWCRDRLSVLRSRFSRLGK